MRRRAALILAAPGAAVHDFCYISETLQRLLVEGPNAAAAAGPRAADWFAPAMHLPKSKVVDASQKGDGQQLSVGGSMQVGDCLGA